MTKKVAYIGHGVSGAALALAKAYGFVEPNKRQTCQMSQEQVEQQEKHKNRSRQVRRAEARRQAKEGGKLRL